jgi:SET domain-containing protein
MTYRPLPDYLKIEDSHINGQGLFTTEKIKSNTIIGITHYANERSEDGWIRTPLGGFGNHSDNPNCVTKNGYWHQIPVKYLATLRDIEAGEELTAKYTLYTVDDYVWE